MKILTAIFLLTFSTHSFSQLMWGNGIPICNNSGNQKTPCATPDSTGAIIVVWADFRGGGFNSDIYAQRIMPDGSSMWVNNGIIVSPGVGYQDLPAVVYGGIVSWNDMPTFDQYNLSAQKLSIDGSFLWGINGISISDTIRDQSELCAISDNAGGAYFSFTDWSATPFHSNIIVKKFDSVGQSVWGSIPLCSALGNQNSSSIELGSDGLYSVWADFRSDTSKIYCQKLSMNGEPLFVLNGIRPFNANGAQENPLIAVTSNNGFYCACTDMRYGFAGRKITLQHLTSEGIADWDSSGLFVSNSLSAMEDPELIVDSFGNAIVAWLQYDEVVPDIYLQKISPAGEKLWGENGILAVELDYDQNCMKLYRGPDNGAMILYTRGTMPHDIYAQYILANGETKWGAEGLILSVDSTEQINPSGVFNGNNFYAFWEDYRDVGWNIYGQKLTLDSLLLLTSPVNGDYIQRGAQDTITWTCTYPASFDLYFSDDGGISYNLPIAQNISGNQYVWTFPDIYTRTAKVKIISFDSGGQVIQQAESDSFFTVASLLSGHVSGALTPAQSPYIVQNGFEIASAQSLTVQPGAEILFISGSLNVNGLLQAVGNIQQPITFKSDNPNIDWQGIFFYDGSSRDCILKYCRIINANIGVKEIDGEADIINCLFDQCYLWGIHLTTWSNVNVWNNTIVNCAERGLGVSSSAASVKNNIISSIGQYGVFCTNATISMSYNNVFDCGISNYYSCTPGSGSISMDPLFTGIEYNLLPNSPCIDTGSPIFPLDPDSTQADMGWRFFNHNPVPLQVQNLTVSICDDSLYLFWSPVIEDTLGNPLTNIQYNIYTSAEPYAPFTSYQFTGQTSDTTWIHYNFQQNDILYYKVTAAAIIPMEEK